MHCVGSSIRKYLILLLRLGHFHLDGANLQTQTHLVPKLMLQNLAIILRPFYYGKNKLIALVLGVQISARQTGDEVF